MPEHRNAQRRRVLKGGTIALNSNCVISCVIRNMSSGGLCLEVPSQHGIPDTFGLIIGTDPPIACKAAWRKGTRIGVQFE